MKHFFIKVFILTFLLAGFAGVSIAEEDKISENIENLLGEIEALQEKSDSGGGVFGDSADTAPVTPETEMNPVGQSGQGAGEAITEENESISIDNSMADSHFHQGMEAWKLNDLDGAIKHFEQSIKERPTDAHAYWNLGIIFDQKKDGRQAIGNMRKAKKIFMNFNSDGDVDRTREFLEKYYQKYGFEQGDFE